MICSVLCDMSGKSFGKPPLPAFVLLFQLLCLVLSWGLPCAGFALTEGETNTISIYEKVAPSVVNITTTICEPEFFFCSIPSSGSGSGIVLKENGIIVTNYHVVENTRTIQVAFEDGRRLEADVVGSSPRDDLAVIRVKVGDRPLKAIVFGDSDRLKVGEKVLAIGNPFGLGRTLTLGTVSMKGRDIRDGDHVLRDLIQTDASINPGNSGGALVNSRGELVGMNTIILSPTGSNVRIGFAIPAGRIEAMAPGLAEPGRGWVVWIMAAVVAYWFFRRRFRRAYLKMR